jgi:hypothetical protein
MLRPLIPLVKDAWDHAFSETIHIATVHAKYGANHLEKELAAGETGNRADGKTQNTTRAQQLAEPHFFTNTFFAFTPPEGGCLKDKPFANPGLCVGFAYIQGPPPKFLQVNNI